MAKRKNTLKLNRTTGLAGLIILILLAGGLWAWHNSTSRKSAAIIPSTNLTKTPDASASATGSKATNSQTQSSASSAKNTAPASPTAPSGKGPAAPFGDFVSTHSPSSSDVIVSVCNTTPGATCYLQFADGGTVKRLATETADSSGATSWSWKLSDAGLTKGSWQITAVASLNGKTATTTDQLALQVK